ncbi:MAG: PHB depolymerase family esterase [Pseudomonadota bacterium]
MALLPDFLAKTKALISQGKLMDATRAIQLGLGIRPAADLQPKYKAEQFSEFAASGTSTRAPTMFKPAVVGEVATDIKFREFARSPVIDKQTSPEAPPGAATTPAIFNEDSFDYGQNRYVFRLFIPSKVDASPLPLVVMLHGCKQDSQDFAAGTAMNSLAEQEKFIVLYPEQLKSANNMGCWNWFDPAHQGIGRGEPGMLAALTMKVMANNRIDPARVYVAGLSAGAAMAALMGHLHPEIFAAVGVHSGLAPGSARSIPSAFSAMAKGPSPRSRLSAIGVPVIVIQGSGDATVAPGNANAIIDGELGFWKSKGVNLSKSLDGVDSPGALRPTTKSVWKTGEGKPKIELWLVTAGPHAWSGGHASGSFTDPKGPDASKAMFDFFKLHTRSSN